MIKIRDHLILSEKGNIVEMVLIPLVILSLCAGAFFFYASDKGGVILLWSGIPLFFKGGLILLLSLYILILVFLYTPERVMKKMMGPLGRWLDQVPEEKEKRAFTDKIALPSREKESKSVKRELSPKQLDLSRLLEKGKGERITGVFYLYKEPSTLRMPPESYFCEYSHFTDHGLLIERENGESWVIERISGKKQGIQLHGGSPPREGIKMKEMRDHEGWKPFVGEVVVNGDFHWMEEDDYPNSITFSFSKDRRISFCAVDHGDGPEERGVHIVEGVEIFLKEILFGGESAFSE